MRDKEKWRLLKQLKKHQHCGQFFVDYKFENLNKLIKILQKLCEKDK